MHEQRLYSRFTKPDGLQDPAITALFIDRDTGDTTSPENTNCQNLSQNCTSSLPYFDGETRDRNSTPPDMESNSAQTQVTLRSSVNLTKI